MQKCSELGNNLEVLSRYGLPALRVNKGPEGHRLVQDCHDQIKKVLPADSYDKLMTWVNRWLKSLDEKDKMTRLRTKSNQIQSKTDVALPVKSKSNTTEHVKKDITKTDNSIVDLCSDDEISDKQSDNLLDCNTVVENSKLVIHDDEYGDINLKDYADHVDGKQIKGTENEENDQGTLNMSSKHINGDEPNSQTTSEKNLELTVGATLKTYVNTNNNKPKPKEALIRVRTDLKAITIPSNAIKIVVLQKEKIQSLLSTPTAAAAASKRKLSIENEQQPGKQCDSTTDGGKSCSKKQKEDSDTDSSVRPNQNSIEKTSPDTTSPLKVNINEPNAILGLTHILGLLDCVESYATWHHNKEAIDLLVQLRDTLKHKSQMNNKQ